MSEVYGVTVCVKSTCKLWCSIGLLAYLRQNISQHISKLFWIACVKMMSLACAVYKTDNFCACISGRRFVATSYSQELCIANQRFSPLILSTTTHRRQVQLITALSIKRPRHSNCHSPPVRAIEPFRQWRHIHSSPKRRATLAASRATWYSAVFAITPRSSARAAKVTPSTSFTRYFVVCRSLPQAVQPAFETLYPQQSDPATPRALFLHATLFRCNASALRPSWP